jgi:hypothetical protein
MPRGDGTGPPSGGGQGRGRGRGAGGGQGGGRRRGGLGPDGTCVCPQCGKTQPHRAGVPCAQEQCPQCGSAMMRQ